MTRSRISSLHGCLSIAIITTMLKAVYFFINDVFSRGEYGSVPGEVKRAVCALRAGGLDSGIVPAEDFPFRPLEAGAEDQPGEESSGGIISAQDMLFLPGPEAGPIQPENTLILCDSGERIRTLQQMGFCTAGYSHAGNRSEQFRGVSYIIQEPDLVDFDSYEKIYERGAGLPWTILKTRRCLVREFTVDDLEGIDSLYDDRARMFLEPPSEDRAHEREILQAYIERIYGLYGFGHWAVLTTDAAAPGKMDAALPGTADAAAPGTMDAAAPGTADAAAPETKDEAASGKMNPLVPGTLIGRIGFSAVTAEKEAQAATLGVSGVDADFGFLVAASCRGTGIAQEVCEALLRYGFESLGFLRVSADADPRNRASIRLLQKLGFTAVGRADGKIFFIRDA